MPVFFFSGINIEYFMVNACVRFLCLMTTSLAHLIIIDELWSIMERTSEVRASEIYETVLYNVQSWFTTK